MTRKILLIFVIPFLLLAQDDNQSQSIELPDFVITGIRSISIPRMKKNKPELVPTLSSRFFKPIYSPDNFNLAKESGPIRRELNLYSNLESNNGLLKLGIGYRTLPLGQFYFNQNSEHFLFQTKIWGEKILDYIDNAGYNESGAKLNTDFYISSQSGFLPGLKISLSGDYLRSSYKFYGSDTPELERETEKAQGTLSLTNSLSESFKYGIGGSTYYLDLKDAGLKEILIEGNSAFDLRFDKMGLAADFKYIHQNLEDTSSIIKDNFIGGNLYLLVDLAKTFKLQLGIHYAEQDTNQHFAPFVSFIIDVAKNMVMGAEYKPNTQFRTVSKFIEANRYFNYGDIQNVFVKNSNTVNLFVKYEFSTYFEISGGAGYTNTDNMIYYNDSEGSKGKFDILLLNDVENKSAFMNFLFHKGPYGYFYGDINYSEIRNKDGNKLPYYPLVSSSLMYGYELDFGLNFNLGFNMFFDMYTDVGNTGKLPDTYNLNLSLRYELIKNFNLVLEFENLLNRKQFYYSDYQMKPFDIIAGLEYRW
ncbi:hypothetical protein ACFLS9_02920 [Bacteroidota bacterium]